MLCSLMSSRNDFSEALMLAALYELAPSGGPAGPVSIGDLANDTRLSVSTVRRHLYRLAREQRIRIWDPATQKIRQPRTGESVLGRRRGEKGPQTINWYWLPPPPPENPSYVMKTFVSRRRASRENASPDRVERRIAMRRRHATEGIAVLRQAIGLLKAAVKQLEKSIKD